MFAALAFALVSATAAASVSAAPGGEAESRAAASVSAAPGGEAESGAPARAYGPAPEAGYRGSGEGEGARRAKLASFAAAVRASEREPAKGRATPALMTERGAADKARAEAGLNDSGKLGVAPADDGAEPLGDLDASFPGIDFGDSGFIPPDVEIAAGPHHIVETTNGTISTYEKNGTQAQTATSGAFFNGLGTIADDFIFDPQVEYNEYAGRFFIVYTTRNDAAARSFLLIAVSNTSDPTQGWSLFGLDAGFDGGTDTNNWCDYPHLGYSTQGILIACNQFTHPPAGDPASFQYVKIRVLLTSQLTGGGCCSWWDFWDLREGASSDEVFTVQPAAMHLAISSDGAFLAAAQGGGGSGSNLHVYRVPNVPECCDGDAIGPGLDEAQRGVGSYASPPDAEQPSSVQALDTGDARLQYAVFHWPRMFVGQNVADGSDSTVAFSEFRIAEYPNNMTLHNDWVVAAGGMNRYYPGTDSRPGEDKSQVYSFSNASNNAGSRWIEIPDIGECTGCFVGEFTQRTGAATYLRLDTRGRNRWGDYLDSARDPNGTGIWIGGQYVDSLNSWGTEITLTRQALDATAPTTTATPSPPANAAGWNNTNVSVALSAADSGPAGNVSGVRNLTFGAFGANPIPTTTVGGSVANVPITADGTTTVFYRATDNWGNDEGTKFLTINKDALRPAFSRRPEQSFQANTTATETTVPVRIRWNGTDAHSGICEYGPLRRKDSPSGPFALQPGLPASPLGTGARQQLEAGFHQYRIRATDCAGNRRTVTGPPARLRIFQEGHPDIAYSAGWSQVANPPAMGVGLRQTVQANRTASFSFDGQAIAWGARRDSASGVAEFRLDGGSPVDVNLNRSATQHRRLVLVRNPAAGPHSIEIRNLATAGNPKATLDFLAWLK